MTVKEIIAETGIIPVIKIDDSEKAVPMAKALLEGGIPAAEVTFRTEAAADSIRRISDAIPEMFVCAGTVLSIEQAETAVKAGAKAIISPGLNEELVKWCINKGTPVFPGCATPSEVEAAMRLGLDTVKLFPAEVVGGVSMLKALAGPYSSLSFMPTGGINTENVSGYLKLKNVIACGGSWICPAKLMDKSDWDGIKKLAMEAAEIVKTARS